MRKDIFNISLYRSHEFPWRIRTYNSGHLRVRNEHDRPVRWPQSNRQSHHKRHRAQHVERLDANWRRRCTFLLRYNKLRKLLRPFVALSTQNAIRVWSCSIVISGLGNVWARVWREQRITRGRKWSCCLWKHARGLCNPDTAPKWTIFWQCIIEATEAKARDPGRL